MANQSVRVPGGEFGHVHVRNEAEKTDFKLRMVGQPDGEHIRVLMEGTWQDKPIQDTSTFHFDDAKPLRTSVPDPNESARMHFQVRLSAEGQEPTRFDQRFKVTDSDTTQATLALEDGTILQARIFGESEEPDAAKGDGKFCRRAGTLIAGIGLFIAGALTGQLWLTMAGVKFYWDFATDMTSDGGEDEPRGHNFGRPRRLHKTLARLQLTPCQG